MSNQERYVFNVEWYDSAAALIRYYNFFYYPSDSTMEMVKILLTVFSMT
jgi:nucleoside-diphosphate kinase